MRDIRKTRFLINLRALLNLNDSGWGHGNKPPESNQAGGQPPQSSPENTQSNNEDKNASAPSSKETSGKQLNNSGNKNDGPPDLDKVWQDFNKKLNGLFGGKSNKPNPWGNSNNGGGGGGGGSAPFNSRGAGIGLGVVAGVLGALWLASGFYILPEGQAAAILRFGEYTSIVEREIGRAHV